jgi:hypothetical protein
MKQRRRSIDLRRTRDRSLAVLLAIGCAGIVASCSRSPSGVPAGHPYADAEAVDFAILAKAEFEEGAKPKYPAAVAGLDGRAVRIAGFMAPYDDLTDLRVFLLFPTPRGCYFCSPTSPSEVVVVRCRVLPGSGDGDELADGEAYPFITGALEARGVLRLWTDASRDPAHDGVAYVLEDALVRELRDDEITPRMLEAHKGGVPKTIQGALPGDSEDF